MKPSAKTYLIVATAIMGATVIARALVEAGYLDGDAGTRSFMAALGIGIAATGNLLPKSIKAPRATIEGERRTQAALRRVGWMMALAGILFAAVWLAFDEYLAQPLSLAAMGAAFLYALRTAAVCKAANAPT